MRKIKFRAWNEKHKDFETGWSYPTAFNHAENNFVLEIPESIVLMQFTGLKDKNGKEIYEGDIVVTSLHKTEPDFFEPVEWADMYGGFHPFSASLLPVGHLYEVIGNIYENKDLLK